MTFDLDTWHAGSSWHYLRHIRRSSSYVKVHDHRRKWEFSNCWEADVA